MPDIQLTTKHRAKINRAIKALNAVRKEIQSDNPNDYINLII